MLKYFSNLFFCLTIAQLIKLTYTQQCLQCVSVLQYKCKFCGEFCSGSDMETFQKCTYLQCQKQKQQTCLTFQYGDNPLTTTKQICRKQCCPTDQKIVQSVKKCLLQNDFQVLKPLIIVSVVIIILVVIFLVRFFYKKFAKRFQDLQSSKKNIILSSQLDATIMEIGSQWNIAGHVQQYPCPICLQSNINTITLCGHHFHFQCLAQWINRTSYCPLCKSTTFFDPIRYLCQKCCKKSLKIQINKIVQASIYKSKMQDLKCLECSNS